MKKILYLLFLSVCIVVSCKKKGEVSHDPIAIHLSDSAAMRISKGLMDSTTISLLDRSIEIDPFVSHRYGMKVDVLNHMNLRNEALEVLNELERKNILQDTPEMVFGHGVQALVVGDTLFANNKFRQALQIFESQLEEKPNSYNIVNVAMLTNALEGAEKGSECLKKLCDEYLTKEEVSEAYSLYNNLCESKSGLGVFESVVKKNNEDKNGIIFMCD